MNVIELEAGLKIVESTIHADERGWLQEDYRKEILDGIAQGESVHQANLSYSNKGALRGMHLQYARPQSKFVKCVTGSIFAVAVDVRPGSPTRDLVQTRILTAEKPERLWIPLGFAFGFLALEDASLVHYVLYDKYDPESAVSFRWDAPELGIDWPLDKVGGKDALLISRQDKAAMEYPEMIALLDKVCENDGSGLPRK